MMESRQILSALGEIKEKFVLEAEAGEPFREAGAADVDRAAGKTWRMSRRKAVTGRKKTVTGQRKAEMGRRNGRGWKILTAACAAILGVAILGGGLGAGEWFRVGTQSRTEETPAVGVVIPPLEVSHEENSVADMIGFFIYQGRVYVQYRLENGIDDLVGEYVGRATGSIDEWSSEEDYVELAGSISGDIYTVNGMSPEFMLCIPRGEQVDLFINDNGLTLETGADLFEERLHLSGNYLAVEYEGRESWFYGKEEVYSVGSEHETVISRFVEAMNEAEFMWAEDIPLEEGQRNIFDDKEIYHLYFRMENGLTVHLRLFDGGYVMFSALHRVCVQIDEAAFSEMTELLVKENPSAGN
ncbi:MAG: hypothetical protein IJZ85_01750 [Lachnospiraceae bacterium]|nr:hypothetical protein [Lachnospiraceae bacterium]